MKRVIWIILDSVGMGEAPDAAAFGDAGSSTIPHTWEYNKGLNIPNLLKLGLGNIDGMKSLPVMDESRITGAYGRSSEKSAGKDTTVGHWEMTGVISDKPFPTYPDGFPDRIINEFIKETGVLGVLGNCVASGTEIIKKLGAEHERTGKPIVYTSADSVFQIAVNVDCFPLDSLYDMCAKARKILTGQDEVARVIARPFTGHDGNYVRTSDRRDYAILPPDYNLLHRLKEQNYDVWAVGKIEDIFAGSGITRAIHTKNNMDGVDVTVRLMKEKSQGLEDFDARLPEIIGAMNDDDILIINADHGCDPTFKGTDHTREYIPVLVYGKNIRPVNFGTRNCFADIGQTIAEYVGAEPIITGEGFLERIAR